MSAAGGADEQRVLPCGLPPPEEWQRGPLPHLPHPAPQPLGQPALLLQLVSALCAHFMYLMLYMFVLRPPYEKDPRPFVGPGVLRRTPGPTKSLRALFSWTPGPTKSLRALFSSLVLLLFVQLSFIICIINIKLILYYCCVICAM